MTVPTTEQPNELACDIDAGTASDIVRTLGKCDSQIFHGWNNFPSIYDETTISSMQKIAKRAVEVLQDSSDTAIVLSGCGTSGRLAFFLAQKFSELAKAQTLPARYEYVIAGGDIALFTSQEASEDDWKKGQEDLAKVSRHKTRVLFIGITCGFSAPYVAGQLDYCMSYPDVFIPVLLGFNPVNQARKNIIEGWNKSFFDVAKSLADCNEGIILNPVVGPEAITGSSRMKGGSATKIILETILLQAHFTLSRPTSPPASILNELLSMFETTYSSTYLDGSKLAGAVKIAAESLQDKGHVYYVGFGLPGFMGLLDASECVPTFSAKFSDVRGFLKGGYRALNNKEGELQLDGSNPLLISLKDFVCKFLPKLMSCDTVVFICPDVKDIQEVEIISQLIDEKGAQIIGIVHEKEKHFSDLFMKSIVYIKQPSRDKKVLLCKPGFTSFVEECLTEISVKWILNAISTGAHVLKGKVVGSFMIDVKVSNNKLFHRAVSIISKFARVDQEKALCAVLQSIYRTDMIDDVLDKLVSEHVARGTVVEQVVPVAVLLATNMFTVESALEVLTTKTVSYVLRNLSQS